ncbi:MAG: NAD(P)/FAD-dependent oxidoreductase [Planctomycetes bacterium]|jgi:hypothetical protein|nr:NAD(P)/FAD-dependent oxidoreductase [Planctomycetota bacterium]
MTTISIIGAGPAGLMAALHAASRPAPTRVLEANAGPGRKLLLTGGGRCNFTHTGTPEEIAQAFGKAGPFVRHALYDLSPHEVREFFRTRGVGSAVEPDGCVFPASNRAADICNGLVAEARERGVQFQYRAQVKGIATAAEGFRIDIEDGPIIAARVILATGGLSWPQTGSRGDGFRFAAQLGHTLVPPQPALVPLVTRETWPRELAGVSLAEVRIGATIGGHRYVTTGPMLFTQNGIGGPTAMDLSRLLAEEWAQVGAGVEVAIDVLPAIGERQLDQRFQEEFQAAPRRTIANILSEFVPRQLSRILCRLAQCDDRVQAGQLPAGKRRHLVHVIKELPLYVTGTEPIAKATVTHGGVSRAEIDPRTMESKLRPGLFFAGEVIDLDGPCGGYNLQMCWSTGALAGRSALRSLFAAGPT